MLDQLYQLLCVPKPPSLSISDLKCNNFNQFLDKTMTSSPSIDESQNLKKSATEELSKLIANKSHSPSNTKRMIIDMFKSASKACHMDRERALIHWLEICVETALEFQDTENNNKIYTEKPAPATEVVPITSSGEKNKKPFSTQQQSKTKKKTNNKNKQDEYESETDVSWEEDDGERYEVIGASDDDYVPSDDDAVVPNMKKTRPTRKTAAAVNSDSSPEEKKKVQRRKKKNQGLVNPPSPPKASKASEATLSVLKEGSGSKAVVKYFNEIDAQIASKSTALSNGYFVRAFFFPSSNSFNAFISVLNSATKTIDICVFAFTDDDVAKALVAAKERNVTIRIITDNQQAAGKGADAKKLSESHGIPFKTDNTTGYMHNKFAIVDSATLINGSFNWSKGARFKNRENIIVTNIPICIKEFQAQFDTLWAEF